MSWSFDISQAPRGNTVSNVERRGDKEITVSRFVPDRVILATKCGKVTTSHFIPDESRWLMLAKGEEPIAWQPWPAWPNAPEHPATKDTPHSATVTP